MLTATQIRTTKPREKPYKLFDERGLYLMIQPNGGRWWRFRYRYQGREKLLSLGTYPDTPLKRAREKRDEARRIVADGGDPSARRQAEKLALADSFEAIAREWLDLAGKPKSGTLNPATVDQLRYRLEKYVFPYIGRDPIASITAPDLLRVLRRIEAGGIYETAHRVRSVCGRVFRYAIATGRAERDVSLDLKGALVPVKTKNFAAITNPAEVAGLLRAIDGYQGQPSVMAALKLAPLVFVRPGELRAAEWSEFNVDAAEWRLPGEKTKMGDQHLVPLSAQAIEIINELQPITGSSRYLFPSLRTNERPISENTLNAALRRLGYAKDEMTAHGFRAMASTLLNEQGFPPDVIERQLGHTERNKVRAAYNRAERLADRRKMMQAWADYLDVLRAGNNNATELRHDRG